MAVTAGDCILILRQVPAGSLCRPGRYCPVKAPSHWRDKRHYEAPTARTESGPIFSRCFAPHLCSNFR